MLDILRLNQKVIPVAGDQYKPMLNGIAKHGGIFDICGENFP